MTAGIEMAHFGEIPMVNVKPTWNISSGEKLIAEGALGQQDIPIGNTLEHGIITYQFQKVNKPPKLTLSVQVNDFSNS